MDEILHHLRNPGMMIPLQKPAHNADFIHPQDFPRISSLFVFLLCLGPPVFSTSQAKKISFFAGAGGFIPMVPGSGTR